MPRLQRTHIEAYVFRRRSGRVEFLCLRRARDRSLGGVWQPVTGKSRVRETALAGAVREVREETGLSPRRWWALETITAYYDPAKDVVLMLPLFAAEAGAREAVQLSEEHDAHRWLPARAAGRLYLWRRSASASRPCAGRCSAAATSRARSRSRPSPPTRAAARSRSGDHDDRRRHGAVAAPEGGATMAGTSSFDVTTGVDFMEVHNAVDQATKEITQRYDFKGVKATLELSQKDKKITLAAPDEFKLKAMWDVLQGKLVRRGVPLKNLKPGTVEPPPWAAPAR